MKRIIIIGFVAFWNCVMLEKNPHKQKISNWEFSRDSLHWQSVVVPHDWAISGPFDKKWDLQKVAIVQNGETEATEKSGRSGSLPWIGKGYYRTHINIDKLSAVAELQFDGAMADAHVRVNGQFVGGWPYGYNAFRLNVADALRVGDNIIEVSLNNLEESSRWYPGGGIYRPVSLFQSDELFIDDWKTQIITDVKNSQIVFNTNILKAGLRLNVDLIDAEGNIAATGTSDKADINGNISFSLPVNKPHLWSPESPYLYIARLSIVPQAGMPFGAKDFRVGMNQVEVNSN